MNTTTPLNEQTYQIQAVIREIIASRPGEWLPWVKVCQSVLIRHPETNADAIYPALQGMARIEHKQGEKDSGLFIRALVPTERRRDGYDPGYVAPVAKTQEEIDQEISALSARREKWQRFTAKLSGSFGGTLDDLDEILDLLSEARGKPVHVTHPGLIARYVAQRVAGVAMSAESASVNQSKPATPSEKYP